MFNKILFIPIIPKIKNSKIFIGLKSYILIPFSLAFIFSIPLYLNIFTYYKTIYFPYINGIFALISIFIFININRKYRFFFGFFVGILWFYWISLSFRFTSSPNILYIVIFFVSVIYGIFFYLLLFFKNKLFRIFSISIASYISILGFDWFVPDSILAFSVFRVDKISFCLITLIIVIISLKSLKIYRFISLFALILLVDFKTQEIDLPSKINITQTNINQSNKWKSLNNVIEYNFSKIQDSIFNGYKVVILPETAFPFVLNNQNQIMQKLLKLSNKITIIVGSQREDNGRFYNSTYVFEDGKYNFADKVFLAPFGEYMPIPYIFMDIFNKISGINYNSNFNTNSKMPKDLITKNITFRNAICYEATTKKAYQNNPKYMIAISNNAWFNPSIEPILQMMLIKYYARLHNTIVLHSTNGSKSGIISPKTSLEFMVKNYNFL
ncbi:apolipoprotein N-acyltransferase [Helicobacter sp. MIT 14-3879]|uniref:apolipoprotein N-acyltransferase n=1 Tax=Helicobacter sp. MIT 14-3879 TaxID=2040649 RepID=UPI000E1F7063|nr:apolipoprotein N-acyltransferase [Helicobacter sp. MIT 14-3879]RDU62283.1 apolipoprotein N-acyltransferase [Helicobacter sp. MIT 14-3879]